MAQKDQVRVTNCKVYATFEIKGYTPNPCSSYKVTCTKAQASEGKISYQVRLTPHVKQYEVSSCCCGNTNCRNNTSGQPRGNYFSIDNPQG